MHKEGNKFSNLICCKHFPFLFLFFIISDLNPRTQLSSAIHPRNGLASALFMVFSVVYFLEI